MSAAPSSEVAMPGLLCYCYVYQRVTGKACTTCFCPGRTNWEGKCTGTSQVDINSLRPRQISCHIAGIFRLYLFLYENCYILIGFWLKFIPKVTLTINQHWFKWWLGAKLAPSHHLNQWWSSSLKDIYITWPQWVNIGSCMRFSESPAAILNCLIWSSRSGI